MYYQIYNDFNIYYKYLLHYLIIIKHRKINEYYNKHDKLYI